MPARVLVIAGLLGLIGAVLLPERMEPPTAIPTTDAPNPYRFVVMPLTGEGRHFPMLVAGISALAILIRRLRR
jgi:hypothetical protein